MFKINEHDPVPLVTVLMPVFNAEAYIAEAIESILRQTFTNFELVVVDDGSTDRSLDIMQSIRDPRIRLKVREDNGGVSAALNLGLQCARGCYIARMDADDICMPYRLEKQVAFLNANPQVGLCGGWMEEISGGRRIWKSPLKHGEIESRLLFESSIFHPTVMMRKKILTGHSFKYDDSFFYGQDYHLWSRFREVCGLANIPKILVKYRVHPNSVGKLKKIGQQESANRIRSSLLEKLGIEPSDDEMLTHEALALWKVGADTECLEKAERWLLRLWEANLEKHMFSAEAFSLELAERWLFFCQHSCLGTFSAYSIWKNSRLSHYCSVPLRRKLWYRLRPLFCLFGTQRV